ncbi:MAG: DUF4350 domain-containing protein [Bernardetiaceae bacterium]|nr:DUF4350 domain-containing protein [Bernardetiaceae bacterium]
MQAQKTRLSTYFVLTISITLILGVVVWYFWFMANTQKQDWRTHFRNDRKSPFGTYVMHQLLKTQNATLEFYDITPPYSDNFLPTETKQKGTYVFIGQNHFIDENIANDISNFVAQGNYAFIATANWSPFYSLFFDDNSHILEYFETHTIDVKFEHQELKNKDLVFEFSSNFQKERQVVSALDMANFIPKFAAQSLAKTYPHKKDSVAQEEYHAPYVNSYIRLSHGKGYFFLCSTPLLLTNWHLKTEKGYKYASALFSHIPPSDIYWDERSRFPPPQEPMPKEQQESILTYILSQPSLAWFYYLLLLTTALYVLWGSKRRQRVIPILSKNKNTSLDFVRTIGKLYYMQKEHKALARIKKQLFFDFIRRHYYLKTEQIDEDFIKKLSLKSQISEEKIQEILELSERIEDKKNYNEEELQRFHATLAHFYQHCK